jgi:hypothetical protein
MSFRTWVAALQVARTFDRLRRDWRQSPRRRHAAYSPFGIRAAQVLENRRLLSALTVTTAANSGRGSLRAEIAAAHSGDTINFAASLKGQTITLTSGELAIDKNLTIQGSPIGQPAISANHRSRVFDVALGVQVTLSGLVIENGSAGDGGGILNRGTLTISNCTISNNSVFSGGSASGEGAGIFNQGTLTIGGCTISNNGAVNFGGGILNQGTLTISGSTISKNGALDGGGILNQGNVTVSGSTISNNAASFGSGGGIDAARGTATLTNCTVVFNTDFGFGNSTGGGGLYVDSSSRATLTNCTLSRNLVGSARGGGIDVNSGGILNLTNTLVAGNTVANPAGPDIYGALATADHNLVGDGTWSSGIANGVNGNIVGGNGNPVINAMLGPLQGNGGPTMSMALLAGSPAIGQADSALAPATDQRGVTRIDQPGELTDIGAYEV